jgi:hypothetical protein
MSSSRHTAQCTLCKHLHSLYALGRAGAWRMHGASHIVDSAHMSRLRCMLHTRTQLLSVCSATAAPPSCCCLALPAHSTTAGTAVVRRSCPCYCSADGPSTHKPELGYLMPYPHPQQPAQIQQGPAQAQLTSSKSLTWLPPTTQPPCLKPTR